MDQIFITNTLRLVKLIFILKLTNQHDFQYLKCLTMIEYNKSYFNYIESSWNIVIFNCINYTFCVVYP